MTRKFDGSRMWLYGWDFENRLVSASNRKETVRYLYDALGRRVQRFIRGGRENTKFIYDGQDVLVDDNSGTLTKYLNGLGIDNKLRVQTGSDVKYFLTDHLGSTSGLADSSGNLTAQTNYDSFGNATNANFPTRYQFTGREFDNFSGLHYYRARFYEGNLGRFISEDPIGFAGGDVNLYGYVWNSPNNLRDSSGLFPSQGAWKYHQRITQRALEGYATQDQINILSQEQYDFDKNTQDEPYAPWHAMARVGQSSQSARDEANRFVGSEVCLAKKLAKMGFESEGLRHLSRAMHTMQDSTSPAHYDFQAAWDDTGFFSYIRHSGHYISESLLSPDGAELAQEQTKKAWFYYNGQAEMPSDYFINNYHDSAFGPTFSPSNTSSTVVGEVCGCE